MNTNEFFYCYSPNLHKHLRDKGIRYTCTGLNENTMRKFWQYKRDFKLNDILRKYTATNPNG